MGRYPWEAAALRAHPPRPCQREPGKAASDRQDRVTGEVQPKARASGPIVVAQDDVVHGSALYGRHGAQKEAWADQPPGIRHQDEDARACSDSSPDDRIPGVGRIGRHAEILHVGREQPDDHQHSARDRKATGDQEQTVDPRPGSRAAVGHARCRVGFRLRDERRRRSGGRCRLRQSSIPLPAGFLLPPWPGGLQAEGPDPTCVASVTVSGAGPGADSTYARTRMVADPPSLSTVTVP